MNLNFRPFLRALCLPLLAFALTACDTAADIRIAGDAPSPGGNADALNPALPENLAGYFYAGKPVQGLIYQCVLDNRPPLSGTTDENGRFVCPRSATVSFFLGVPGEKTRKLGELSLDIFGSLESATAEGGYARADVLVTPASIVLPSPVSPLGITATDGDIDDVNNLYNLLVSLDTVIDRTNRYQETIVITDETHAALVNASYFESIELTDPKGIFITELQALIAQILPNIPDGLVLATARPAMPVLSAPEATEYANTSLMRARSGLYRTNSLNLATNAPDSRGIFLTTEFIVGNGGAAYGFSHTLEIATGAISTPIGFSMLLLGNSATVAADGTLSGFDFLEYFADGSFGSNTMRLSGALINDLVTGEDRLCNPSSPNELIPDPYCEASPSRDGFSLDDAGVFQSPIGAPVFVGDLYMDRYAYSLPDIDLDLLPAGYLPRTFEVSLSRYTDVQKAEFQSADYADVSADKTVFGAPAPYATMRYTVMANGDIVSDSDGDCEDLTLVGSAYRDSGLTTEYLIGRVGNVFEGNEGASDDYLTMQFMSLDPAFAAHHGLTIGYQSLYRPTLFPAVLRVADGRLLSKNQCVLDGTCNYKIEWFNDIRYMLDVAIPDLENSGSVGEEAADDAIHKNATYYGQVSGNVEVTGSTGICRSRG